MIYSKQKTRGGISNSSNQTMGEMIISLWIIGISVIFPLIVDNAYFNILPTKFYTYCIITGIMIVLMFCWHAFGGRIDKTLSEIKKLGFKEWFLKEYDLTDRFMLVFIVIAIIATLCAYPYIQEAFIGYRGKDSNSGTGRYTGLLLLLLYVISYFYVSRDYKFKNWHFIVFMAAADIVCLFGITDYFSLNLAHFKDNMQPHQINLYTSTIGNINTYTTYVAYVVAFAGTMFIVSDVEDLIVSEFVGKKNKEEKDISLGLWIFYFVSFIIGLFALAMGKSDNGYLTLIAFFSFVPFIAFKKKYGIRRYILTLALYFSVIKIICILNVTFPNNAIGIDGLYNVIANFKYLNWVIVLLWALTLSLYAIKILGYQKVKDESVKIDEMEKCNPLVVKAWAFLVALGFVGVVGMFYYANTVDESKLEFLGGIKEYLVFNDHWGTNRGYIWRAGLEEYIGRYPWYQKIFGTGPDTFGLHVIPHRGNEMLKITGQSFDSAHNEYLQYLTTIGPIGLISYLGVLVTVIMKGITYVKHCLQNKKGYVVYMQASACLILCYAVQAIVNINLPISTPIMWMFMSILVGIWRENTEKVNKSKA